MFGQKLEHAKTPWWIRIAIPLAIWRVTTANKEIFFTFDDGPTPGVTDRLLDLLNEHSAKGTFFCQGEQVRRYPDLFHRILNEGHAIGNHGSSHLNGWKTSITEYLADVDNAASIIRECCGFEPRLFRPPFGRLKWHAMFKLSKKYQIVMWDSMSMDYRTDLDSEMVAQNVINSACTGSIILWHDSEMAAKHLWAALPCVLRHFTLAGFKLAALSDGRPRGSASQPVGHSHFGR